jgi:hypothetical protein
MENTATAMNMGDVSLSDVLEEVLQRIGLKIPQGFLVESDLNDLPPVFGSKHLISEIFNKILDSHIEQFSDYLEEDSHSSEQSEGYRIKITADSEGASTKVRFADNIPSLSQTAGSSDGHFLRSGMMQMDGFFDAGFNSEPDEDSGAMCQLYFLNNPQ